MNTRAVIYAVTLAIGVAFTVKAINLQAYIAPPVLSTDRLTSTHNADDGAEAYPIQLPFNSQLCPC
jgi:hypothetical protein